MGPGAVRLRTCLGSVERLLWTEVRRRNPKGRTMMVEDFSESGYAVREKCTSKVVVIFGRKIVDTIHAEKCTCTLVVTDLR